jgi:hypothetical protein
MVNFSEGRNGMLLTVLFFAEQTEAGRAAEEAWIDNRNSPNRDTGK